MKNASRTGPFRSIRRQVNIRATSTLVALYVFAASPALATEPAAAFPKASPGETRWKIQLPMARDEDRLKVELIPGKMALVDCNAHRLQASLEEENLSGWGYTYYRLKSNGQMMSTLMACIDSTRKTSFVSGSSMMLPYNSRLPVMIYAPDGFEIRYRIWHARDIRQASKD